MPLISANPIILLMNKFDFFNRYREPVIILNSRFEVAYINNSFKRKFKNFTDVKKFSHNMNFDICPLDTGKIENYSPLYLALTSKEDFSACISYETGDSILYFDLYAVKRGLYTIIFLLDNTSENEKEYLKKENEKLKNEVLLLKSENNELANIKQKAQAQAIRIALINKVSNIIRQSINISDILRSTLYELANMFGAYKAYYAKFHENKFLINETYGEKNSINTIDYDENTLAHIFSDEITVTNSLLEYKNAQPFKQPVMRTIVPIHHMSKLIGIIVLLSHSKREYNEELEILDAISSQLANAISRAELYQKNIDTVKELKTALENLKATQLQLVNSEKMASLGQLVAGIAHEINTPVASIKSNNELFAKLIPQIDNNNIKEMADSLNMLDKEAISRINKMVVSLKKFVRLDEAELQEANINNELDLTLELIRHETKNRIDIVKNYGNLPLVRCFPNALNQVFTNILVNACQSIKDKGTITITTSFKAETLTVSIKDTGCGIKSENLEKIFSVGFTTKGPGIGTGLGLAISQKIINQHGGEITVKSEVNKGSEFVITIHSK